MEEEKVKFIRASMVAKRVSCGLSTVWLWAKQGKITPIKISNSITVFDVQEIDRMILGNKNENS
ncbi:MAG: hypothetical protein L3J10_04805 [Sulfurimonas sp.]|nr:hypothetical protein [Sulfurimonas sp.]